MYYGIEYFKLFCYNVIETTNSVTFKPHVTYVSERMCGLPIYWASSDFISKEGTVVAFRHMSRIIQSTFNQIRMV